MSAREDYAALADLAAKATPGPWKTAGASVQSVATGYIMEGKSPYIGSLSSLRGPEQRDADCEYIAAANPAIVTALIERLIECETALRAIVDDWSEATNGHPHRFVPEHVHDNGAATYAEHARQALARARSHLDISMDIAR